MLNVDFLEYVVEFAKTENLSKASGALHISQSALTRAMQKIEEYVGVPLFERSKNKLSLTETGREFVRHAEAVLEAERNMIGATLDFYAATTQVSVGLLTLAPIFKYGGALYGAFGDKSIKSRLAHIDELTAGLKNGVFDLAFLPEPMDADGLISRYAFSERLYVVVPKKHFVAGMTEGVRFSEIDRQSFLTAGDLGVWDEVIRRELPQSNFYSQSVDELEAQINASTIPGFTTDMTLNFRETKDRINIPILDDGAKMDFYVVYKKENLGKIQGFLNVISN